MVVCGFAACEMFGLDYTAKRYRMFSLLPIVGVFGVTFHSPMWAPILASAICPPMLLIAYVAFFIMNNKKSLLGKLVPTGANKLAWNVAMIAAMIATCIGIAIKFKGGVIDKLAPTTQQVAAPDGRPEPPA